MNLIQRLKYKSLCSYASIVDHIHYYGVSMLNCGGPESSI